jgi:hypothetical protein
MLIVMRIKSLERHTRYIAKLMYCVIDNGVAFDDGSFALLFHGKLGDIDFIVDHKQWVNISKYLVVK